MAASYGNLKRDSTVGAFAGMHLLKSAKNLAGCFDPRDYSRPSPFPQKYLMDFIARDMPKVSVIIPTYNRRDLVQQAIDSVLAQTFTDYEIVVVDDGSTDGTKGALVERYGERVRYIWQENQGESVARNKAIDMARGEYIALLDSDDIWLPEKLDKQISVLNAIPKATVLFSQAWLVDAPGQRLDLPSLGAGLASGDTSLEELCIQNKFVASTAIVRRSALDEVGGFDERIRFGEDWDLWLRLRARNEFEFLPEPLASVRRRPNNQCHLPNAESIERALEDHLRLLEKAFSTWQGTAQALSKVRNHALARQYLEAAFASYAWSRWEQGPLYLEQARDLDATFACDSEYLTGMLINYGIAITKVEGTFRLDRSLEYIDGTLSHLPVGFVMPLGTHKRVLGRLYAEEAYLAHLCANRRALRDYTWQAFRADPGLMKDRGMVRRLLASVF